MAQTAENEAAQAFWKTVIASYTGGTFTETVLDNAEWRGPVLEFDNSVPAPESRV